MSASRKFAWTLSLGVSYTHTLNVSQQVDIAPDVTHVSHIAIEVPGALRLGARRRR